MSDSQPTREPDRRPVTVPEVRSRKLRDDRRAAALIMVTAYDYPSAQAADRAGVDIILVGDSLANVVLGYETTNQATLDDMVRHTAAAARARPRALLVGDMPWMSFHVSREDTLRNAARLIREGGAEAVKLEGGAERAEMIKAIRSAEIPVMGHIGLTPQSVHATGGYKVAGRGAEDARRLLRDAAALEEAGVFALVLEGVPTAVAKVITDRVSIPTIGIGAGPHTDGQVLVLQDMLGMNPGFQPKFLRRFADGGGMIGEAVNRFHRETCARTYPAETECYS